MHPLRVLIRRFDGWLSHVEGVEPFSDDPLIILRLQHNRAAWNIHLLEGTIPIGAKVITLHLWNERIPCLPPRGADLAWARQFQRLLIHSLRCAAAHISQTPGLHEVQAVGGVTAQISLTGMDGGRALLEHLGFSIFPYHRPAGAFGEFWENFYTWWLIWTFNPASAKRHTLFTLRRSEFWMTKRKFLENFGNYLPAAKSGKKPATVCHCEGAARSNR